MGEISSVILQSWKARSTSNAERPCWLLLVALPISWILGYIPFDVTTSDREIRRGKGMSTTRSALLRACLLAFVPMVTFAQTPVIVEAESGTLGSSLTVATDPATAVTYITTTENSAVTPTPARTATY